MITTYPRLKWLTGDNALDMIACAYADAFDEAETNVVSRMEILGLFTLEALQRLYTHGIITWDPVAVPQQMTLEVML